MVGCFVPLLVTCPHTLCTACSTPVCSLPGTLVFCPSPCWCYSKNRGRNWLVNGPIDKPEADLTLMMCLFGKMALSSRGEERSVVTFLGSLTSSLGDGSVVTWRKVLELLMVRMEKCLPLRCCSLSWVDWKTAPTSRGGRIWHLWYECFALCHRFPCEELPTTLCVGFLGAGSIRKVP